MLGGLLTLRKAVCFTLRLSTALAGGLVAGCGARTVLEQPNARATSGASSIGGVTISQSTALPTTGEGGVAPATGGTNSGRHGMVTNGGTMSTAGYPVSGGSYSGTNAAGGNTGSRNTTGGGTVAGGTGTGASPLTTWATGRASGGQSGSAGNGMGGNGAGGTGTGASPLTTWATGGLRASGGQSGSAGNGMGGNGAGGRGTSALLASLVGEYDIELALPTIDGCQTYRNWSHFNTRVVPNKNAGIDLFVSEDWTYSDLTKFTVGDNELVVPQVLWGGDTLRPELRLPLGSAGFTGAATAEVPYLCSTAIEMVPVSGTIGPDITPPRLHIMAETPGSVLLPFDLFLFDFSESVIPETAWEAPVHVFTDPPAALGIVDVQTGLAPDYYWTNWPWGPPSVIALNDRTGMNNHSITVELRQRFTDLAGHSAVVERSSYPLLNAGLPVQSIDFDLFDPETAHGNAQLVPASLANSPCESGACLALDYAARTCLGRYKIDEPTPTFFAARLLREAERSIDVRYRILSSQRESPALYISEAAGCRIGYDEMRYDLDPLDPLDAPDGDFTYGTAWLTANNPFCMAPVQGESGILIALSDTCASPGGKFRLLLERLEVVP